MNYEWNLPLVLVGGGGHALSAMACLPEDCDIAGYVDFKDNDLMSLPRIANDDDFLAEVSPREFAVLITFVSGADGSLETRRRVIERYRAFHSPTVVAPTAWTARDARIGAGTVVFHRAVVNAGAKVGEHSVINTGAIVEHNSTVGSNVFIGPGVVVCGGVEIGDNVYIGAGAILKPGVKVGSDVFIGLGSVVSGDLVEGGRYVGMPARRVK